MPLEIPNLDNRAWTELVEEARSLIPRIAPRWTDHNVHDPGITFIELFAWLAEMQLYQLNRVGQKHREVFARLAGASRETSKPARVWVEVKGALTSGVFLPAGTQLTPLEGQEIIFEADADLFLTRSKLERVLIEGRAGRIDQTDANDKPGISFLPFGENADQDAMLMLGFDQFYQDTEREIRITANVLTEDLNVRCGLDDPAKIDPQEDSNGIELVWEFLVTGKRWLPLEVLSDTSNAFSHSGVITLSVPNDALNDLGLFWIRSRIKQGYYDIEPRLHSVKVNVLPCSQKQTVRNEFLGEGNSKPDQSFELKHRPVLIPGFKSTVDSSSVADWDLLVSELQKSDLGLATRLQTLSTSANALAEYDRIRVLSKAFASSDSVLRPPKKSDGEGQTGVPDRFGHLLGRQAVFVSVGNESWSLVPSFDNSNPLSKHYTFDLDRSCIEFGNGLNGQVPMVGQQVRAIWYQVSSGRSGNIARGLAWKFKERAIPGVTLTNEEPAKGGADTELLDVLELRTRSLLERPNRGVTMRDLEHLALSTPNAYVARAKAIANCPVPESISVVVVPKVRPGRTGKPKPPSDPFLRKVERHIEMKRLLGDNLRVIGPIYLEVSITAKLRLQRGAGRAVFERAKQALDNFLKGELQPADQAQTDKNARPPRESIQSPCPTRWPFGRWVFPSEVYAILDGVIGVDFVSELQLSATRNGTRINPDKTGAIPVPASGLVYAGSHNLSVEPELRRSA